MCSSGVNDLAEGKAHRMHLFLWCWVWDFMLKNVDTNSNLSVKHWAAGSRASRVVSIKGWAAGWELHCDIVCFGIVWSGCLCERMAWHLC